MNLSDQVKKAIESGKKIEAIKLLREEEHLELRDAKDRVEEYSSELAGVTPSPHLFKRGKPPILTILLIGTFLWMVINAIEVVGSCIILKNELGYHETTFTVTSIEYEDDNEGNFILGFKGELPDGSARYFDPDLVNRKRVRYDSLCKRYPVGTRFHVWYNPMVTKTLFQRRSLNVIRYTPSIVSAEIEVLQRWALFALLPFLFVLLLLRLREKSSSVTIS